MMAFLATVHRNMPAIRKAIGAQILDPKFLTVAEKLQYEGFQRRQQTNRMVRRMADDGVPIKRMMRLTGLSRGLVRQIVCGEREGVLRIRKVIWLLGCRGWNGDGRRVNAAPSRRCRPGQAKLPARRIARLLTMGRDRLCRADAVQVAQIEASLPVLATARQLTDRFTDMVRTRARRPWLTGSTRPKTA